MKPFNIRIYGLLIHENKILLIKEPFAGDLIVKFPGGGLEYGEGTRDCLVRELKEELDLNIEVGDHFYTQDYFLPSRFDENEQIIMVYYRISAPKIEELMVIDEGIEELIWKDISELKPEDMSLETDQLVIKMLVNEKNAYL